MRLKALTLVSSLAFTLPSIGLAAGAPAATAAKLTFTNKVVDGKKTWIPGEASVPAGAEVEITLVNTLPEPHGFNVPGLVDNVVVDANATKKVTATAKAAGKLAFNCQLHPAHVGGQITVQ